MYYIITLSEPVDYLPKYEYYRMYLDEENSMCRIMYKEKENVIIKIEDGTYIKQDDDTIILRFKNYEDLKTSILM